MAYRYLARNLVDGAVLTELPLRQVRYERKLLTAGTGKFRGTLQLPELTDATNRALAGIYMDATIRRKRTVVVERDGQVMGEWLIWHRATKGDPATITIRGEELWSYLHARLTRWAVSYTQADAGTISRAQLTQADDLPGGDIGIVVGSETTGQLVDVVLDANQTAVIAEIIEDLATMHNGFDISLDTQYVQGVLTRTFRIHYPYLGGVADDLVFDRAGSVLKIDTDESGQGQANWISGRGDGHGDDQLYTTAQHPTELSAGFALFEADRSYIGAGLDNQTDLQAHADADVRALADSDIYRAVTRGDLDPLLGSYQPGDHCWLQSPAELDSRWPDGLRVERRIVAYEVEVPESGDQEIVALGLGRPWDGAT